MPNISKKLIITTIITIVHINCKNFQSHPNSIIIAQENPTTIDTQLTVKIETISKNNAVNDYSIVEIRKLIPSDRPGTLITVINDDKLKLFKIRFSKGTYSVRFLKDGYYPVTTHIKLDDKSNIILVAKLAPDPNSNKEPGNYHDPSTVFTYTN